MNLLAKHTDPNGNDLLVSVQEVLWDSANKAVTLVYSEDGEDFEVFDSGVVYVMNDQGTTVQVYRMKGGERKERPYGSDQ